MNFDVAVWREKDPWRVIGAAEKIDGKIERLWLPETVEFDSVSILGAIAARTSRLKLGAAILNIYTRTIPLIAMTAGTLQLVSKNRFSLGIGVSTNNILEKHGSRIEQPLRQIRLAIQKLRIAQSHGNYDKVGTFSLPFIAPYPIYVGTIGEQLSSVAGESADGLLLNCATPEYAKRLATRAINAADRSGRNGKAIDIRNALIFSLDPQRDRESIARRLAYYGAAESYNRMFKKSGFLTESQQLSTAWEKKDSIEAQRAISDRMVETLTATPENIANIAQSYASCGITGITLVPVDFANATEYLANSQIIRSA
jgi:alkanesulfonate monooxygenase SsuD/methylene tetrahydromethanopterin reductase-like flavin-dependent oxidoreductase (luciferase family)